MSGAAIWKTPEKKLLFFSSSWLSLSTATDSCPTSLFSHVDAACHLRSVQAASKGDAEVGQAGAGLLKLPQAPPGYKRLDLSARLPSHHCSARRKQLFMVLREGFFPSSVEVKTFIRFKKKKFYIFVSRKQNISLSLSSLIHLLPNLHVFRNQEHTTNAVSNRQQFTSFTFSL